jgi:hypothetical protein
VGLIHHAERKEFVTALAEVAEKAQSQAAARGGKDG